MTGDECREAGRKQFCVNGHDTYVCGRTNANRCRECRCDLDRSPGRRERQREYERTYDQSPKGRARHEWNKGWASVRTRRKRAARIAERENTPRQTGEELLSALLNGEGGNTA